MKKLNKKGFTLVELLAVIVILALLIVVVANTALPAMNSAKKSTLETYAKRVVEQAKTLYTSAEIGVTVNGCTNSSATVSCTFTDIKQIMGQDADTTYSLGSSGLTITKTSDTYTISGAVTGSGYTTTIDSTATKMYATS